MKQIGGGEGEKFVMIEVQGKYGSGIRMKIVVRGTEIESEVSELNEMTNRIRDRIASAPKYTT